MVLKTLTQSDDVSNMKNEFPQREEFPQSETHQLGICNGPEILIIQALFQGKIEGEVNRKIKI